VTLDDQTVGAHMLTGPPKLLHAAEATATRISARTRERQCMWMPPSAPKGAGAIASQLTRAVGEKSFSANGLGLGGILGERDRQLAPRSSVLVQDLAGAPL
jgi:hypothetical protein